MFKRLYSLFCRKKLMLGCLASMLLFSCPLGVTSFVICCLLSPPTSCFMSSGKSTVNLTAWVMWEVSVAHFVVSASSSENGVKLSSCMDTNTKTRSRQRSGDHAQGSRRQLVSPSPTRQKQRKRGGKHGSQRRKMRKADRLSKRYFRGCSWNCASANRQGAVLEKIVSNLLSCCELSLTCIPPHCPCGEASTSRAADLGSFPCFRCGPFSRLNHTSHLKLGARRLALYGQCWDELAWCQYCVTRWDSVWQYVQFSRSVPEVTLAYCWDFLPQTTIALTCMLIGQLRLVGVMNLILFSSGSFSIAGREAYWCDFEKKTTTKALKRWLVSRHLWTNLFQTLYDEENTKFYLCSRSRLYEKTETSVSIFSKILLLI